jgi:ubiquinone/menaquinone biosynthesis C-methylase UbiE
MDSAAEAQDYDAMDHAEVNRIFVADLLRGGRIAGEILDVGTGTAQIPIELCRQDPQARVLAIDLAEHMLRLAATNIRRAGFAERIRLERVDGKRLPYADRSLAAVISNSIVHHIPAPHDALAEIVRVTSIGGRIFVRDLLRPANDATVRRLVDTYAAGANQHQRQMFDDSLRAALDLDEIRAIVVALGFDPDTVRQTSDRHWTWQATKVARLAQEQDVQ